MPPARRITAKPASKKFASNQNGKIASTPPVASESSVTVEPNISNSGLSGSQKLALGILGLDILVSELNQGNNN